VVVVDWRPQPPRFRLAGSWDAPAGGLIGLLVLFAAVGLLFLGQYQRVLYDLVRGRNRWLYRVIVYVALMRDDYPAFRLDQGGSEPGPGAAPPTAPPHGEVRVAWAGAAGANRPGGHPGLNGSTGAVQNTTR